MLENPFDNLSFAFLGELIPFTWEKEETLAGFISKS